MKVISCACSLLIFFENILYRLADTLISRKVDFRHIDLTENVYCLITQVFYFSLHYNLSFHYTVIFLTYLIIQIMTTNWVKNFEEIWMIYQIQNFWALILILVIQSPKIWKRMFIAVHIISYYQFRYDISHEHIWETEPYDRLNCLT